MYKRQALNSNKIITELRWKPSTDLKRGLHKTFMWYYDNSKYYSSLKSKNSTRRIGLKK